MRVGIVLGSSIKSGGGFQHEIAILENLKLFASGRGHQFFVFYYDFPFDTKSLECDHLKFIKVKKKQFILQSINRVLIKIKKSTRVRLFQSIKTPLHKHVVQNNIELMYYPGPYGECINIDIPYILTVWDLQHRLQPEFPEVSSNGEWENRERFYRAAIGKAFAIIVDEEAGKEDIIRFYDSGEEKVFVLPFTPPKINRTENIDINYIKNKYKIYSDYIFYPAQFWPHKNHVAILKAIKVLKEEYNTDISAVFVGSDKGNLSYIKKLSYGFGLDNQFFFLGFVQDEYIPVLYKGALALVMPTYFGPSNIPICEAFAYQCPVITSDIRGIREQVGDAGILVNPADYKALSEAIFSISKDKALREKLIVNGTKKIQSWTGKDYIENLIKIIDSFSNKRLCWDKKYRSK